MSNPKPLEEQILEKQGQSWFSEEVEMENETSFISWHDALKAMREFSDTKNAIFKSALDEISNPIKYMQLRAEEKGHSLNGIMAIQISKDPEYLKSIAEKAINNQGLSHE